MKKRSAPEVLVGAVVTVFLAVSAVIGFLDGASSLAPKYAQFADEHPRMGWGLLLLVSTLAALYARWQRSQVDQQRSADREVHEQEVSDLREKVGQADESTERMRIRSELAEGELETARREVDQLREPRRIKADVALAEETLGDLGVDGRARGVIVDGNHECKYFERWFLDPLDDFRHQAPETLERLKDKELRDRLSALLEAINKFHDATAGLLFVRRPHDPGRGDFMLVQPPEGPWASENPADPWRAYYAMVTDQQDQLGEVREALVDVERRLHELRVDYP